MATAPQTKVILTLVGSDRPGLTGALAAAVLGAGGNWLESHLSRLGGKYVGSVLVELPPDQVAALQAGVGRIDAEGLSVAVMAAGDAAPDGVLLTLSVVGQDRLGIVHEVTSALGRIGANIEALTTETEDLAWSGGRLFKADLSVRPAPGSGEDAVRGALEAISADIMVDFAAATVTA